MSRNMATITEALFVFILINFARLGYQLEGPSSREKIIYHSQTSIKRLPLPRKILHGIKGTAMVKEEKGVHHSESEVIKRSSLPEEILDRMKDDTISHRERTPKTQMRNQAAVAELKSDVVDNSNGITSSEIRKKVRLLIEGHADLSADLDRNALYKSRIPSSDASDCTHAGVGVCPPIHT